MNVQYAAVAQFSQTSQFTQFESSGSNGRAGQSVQVSASFESTSSVYESRQFSDEQSFSLFEKRLASSASIQFVTSSETASEADQKQAENPNSAQKVADSILGFIEGRLRADKAGGATEEQLQSRLEAGLKGFKQGFGEAAEMLEQMDLMTSKVKSDIGDTYNRVTSGIDELGKTYAPSLAALKKEEAESAKSTEQSLIESAGKDKSVRPKVRPDLAREIAPQEKVATPSSSASYESVDFSRGRSFSFDLTTQDGDTISIDASTLLRYQEERSQASSGGSDISTFAYSAGESSAFDLKINGDIDQKEWAAFTELFDQVIDLAENFFDGDITQAIEKSLSLGYDSNEIAEFSLSLTQTTTVSSVAAYEQIQPQSAWQAEPISKTLSPLQNYAKELLDSLAPLEQEPRQLFADLLSQEVLEREKSQSGFGLGQSEFMSALLEKIA